MCHGSLRQDDEVRFTDRAGHLEHEFIVGGAVSLFQGGDCLRADMTLNIDRHVGGLCFSFDLRYGRPDRTAGGGQHGNLVPIGHSQTAHLVVYRHQRNLGCRPDEGDGGSQCRTRHHDQVGSGEFGVTDVVDQALMVHIGEHSGISRIGCQEIIEYVVDLDIVADSSAQLRLKAVQHALHRVDQCDSFHGANLLGPVHNHHNTEGGMVVEHPPLPKSSHLDVIRFSYLPMDLR